MGNFPFGGNPGFQRQATLPAAGFALVNASPTILSWTAPNDGNQHRAIVFSSLVVTTLEVGGLILVDNTAPGGATVQDQLFASALAAGSYAGFSPQVIMPPGGTMAVVQFAPLTSGAATIYAEIWGS